MPTANPDGYYSKRVLNEQREKGSCFLFLLQFEIATLIRQTKKEYV